MNEIYFSAETLKETKNIIDLSFLITTVFGLIYSGIHVFSSFLPKTSVWPNIEARGRAGERWPDWTSVTHQTLKLIVKSVQSQFSLFL